MKLLSAGGGARVSGCFRVDAGESSARALAHAGWMAGAKAAGGRPVELGVLVTGGVLRRGAVICGGPVPCQARGCLDFQHPCVQNGTQCQQGFRLGGPPRAGIAWGPQSPQGARLKATGPLLHPSVLLGPGEALHPHSTREVGDKVISVTYQSSINDLVLPSTHSSKKHYHKPTACQALC